MAARVYIWRDANTRKSLGEFKSFCELEPQARFYISTFKFDQTLSRVSFRLFKPWASIFYFFYKIRQGNMLWRHNRVCIAWYKHGNWPITACVRHNWFYNSICISTLPAHYVYFIFYISICFSTLPTHCLYLF